MHGQTDDEREAEALQVEVIEVEAGTPQQFHLVLARLLLAQLQDVAQFLTRDDVTVGDQDAGGAVNAGAVKFFTLKNYFLF